MNELVIYVASAIGGLSLLIILLMVTVRSLIDVGLATNLLPAWLVRRAKDVKREELRAALQELGLTAKVDSYRALSQCEAIPATVLTGRYKESLQYLINDAIVETHMVVGRDIDINLHYFVNLRERCLSHEYAERCAKIMCEFLREKIAEQRAVIEAIVTQKNGSVFLAYEVARILDLPLLIVSEKAHIKTGQGREELKLEGHGLIGPENIQSAVFIDDSTTDGHMVVDCANALRKHSIRMPHAFVLFYRKEGGAKKALEAADVQLHSVVEVDDETLADHYRASGSA